MRASSKLGKYGNGKAPDHSCACNLYSADGVLAGKSDPYVIVEVPGQQSMKFQTNVISNELNPVWNFVDEIAGFMDGDLLRFTVMDKDTFPKPDDFLGKAELQAQDFYPNGFHGKLTLAESKTQATLSVMIVITGHDADPAEMESSSAAFLASGIIMQGLPVYSGVPITSTTTSHSMTHSMPPDDVVIGEFVEGTNVEGSSRAPSLASGVIMQGLQVYHPGVGTKREADFNDTEAVDETFKIKKKKKKSKRCC